jgi:hypothetical protein
MNRSFYLLLIFALTLTVCSSCKKEKEQTSEKPSGRIILKFAHKVDGQALDVDTLKYTNTAGNEYLVNEIQYFISDVTLHNADGGTFLIKAWDDIHYIDTDIPSTWTWNVMDSIPVGSYNSVSFTFGISQAKNQSYMFVNPPENNMFWPEYLGGGYHYMKLDGKWKDTTGTVEPFTFHLGIGQTYASGVIVVDSITGFVQNYFDVTLPGSAFAIADKETRTIEIVMNVESWFDTPHVWDFNYWGSYIMQNQAALQTVKENGADVFTVGSIQ